MVQICPIIKIGKMKNSTLIENISYEEILKEFKEIRDQIREIKEKFEPKKPTEYLTRNEVAEMLKCDLSTLWNWQKKGKIIPYGIGNRIYFKRSEIEEAIISLQRKDIKS
jgi:excisionase family DNA binding protein